MSPIRHLGRLFPFLIWLLIALIISSCAISPERPSAQPESPASASSTQSVGIYTYQIIHTYPHDSKAFTEGLVFDNGILYEGTGLNGESSIRKVDLTTGNILQIYQLPAEYFGEGITIYKDTLIQLTWKSHVGFIYDKNTFDLLHQFSYPTEGWGLTYDGKRLILSDGTPTIHFLDPVTFRPEAEINVENRGTPTDKINELEFIGGKIYANIWQTDKIAIIDPLDGKVSALIDLTGLLQTQKYTGTVDVLNGIAYDSLANRLFVTGKSWPFLFEIKLVAQ